MVRGRPESDWDVGYLARSGSLLLATAVRSGTAYRDWWGRDHWYDQKTGEGTGKVAAETLFAVDAASGERVWERRDRGLVLHPTLAVQGEAVYFVEAGSAALREEEERRITAPEMWNDLHLVRLDRDTGKQRWRVPLELRAGAAALYLVATSDHLVLTTSEGGVFEISTFLTANGRPGWSRELAWETDHHGKHLSRPAVVDGRIFLRPHVLTLSSGESQPLSFPEGHTCSSYTLTKESVLLRAGSFTMWSPDTDAITRWPRLRPDCWISTIPALGMLLSPEGGGGCSCGGWLETSLGFTRRQ